MSAVAFPAAAALISLACLAAVLRDTRGRPSPDKVAWGVAFGLFAIAAGSEVVGALRGWTPILARLYYLAGAVMVVGFLALGQLYLLAPRRLASIGPGAALLTVAVAAALVWAAPVDQGRLGAEGWQALQRDGALRGLTIGLNAGGSLVVVGGTLWSAWRFWRRGIQRHRMIGCLLIALGTLTVGSGGTLTRLGRPEYLYLAMAAGVTIIFVGYLEARRPDRIKAPAAAAIATAEALPPLAPPVVVTAAIPGGPVYAAPPAEPAVAFIETHLLPLDDEALTEAARVWSAAPSVSDRFDRAQARRAWALRLRLSAAAQAAFDAHSVTARLQMVELYHDVLAASDPAADPSLAPLAEPRATSGARVTELGDRQATRGAG